MTLRPDLLVASNHWSFDVPRGLDHSRVFLRRRERWGPKPSAEESQQWLGALNDLRLTLDSRLEITDECDADPHHRLRTPHMTLPVTLL
ncbi:uncharacterized protein SAZU_5791 [Streptomyces azureus]|uniref:Uncharacterized protein n=1 Tax=Streptomyces azureus TaxID=146537 RepID=A0A0K8PT16_STRAJ|nr:uncharacterized protein SAZU_5791 [Streptomyces azureus]